MTDLCTCSCSLPNDSTVHTRNIDLHQFCCVGCRPSSLCAGCRRRVESVPDAVTMESMLDAVAGSGRAGVLAPYYNVDALTGHCTSHSPSYSCDRCRCLSQLYCPDRPTAHACFCLARARSRSCLCISLSAWACRLAQRCNAKQKAAVNTMSATCTVPTRSISLLRVGMLASWRDEEWNVP